MAGYFLTLLSYKPPVMKMTRFSVMAVLICSFFLQPAYSQNKKLDKALRKVDSYYLAGSFSKALKGLK